MVEHHPISVKEKAQTIQTKQDKTRQQQPNLEHSKEIVMGKNSLSQNYDQ